MQRTRPERDIQKAILSYLSIRRIVAWRQNAGAVVAPAEGRHARRYVQFCSMPGVADIIGCLPGGRFLAIEVKSAKGRVRKEQQEFLDLVNQTGGLAFVARSVDDVMEALPDD